MDKYMKANQDWWNEAAQVHAQGDAYLMKEFIDFFHEHPFCAWDCLPEMEEEEDRSLRFKDVKKRDMIPLMFSLKATKK